MKRATIVIIDDEPNMLELVTDALQSEYKIKSYQQPREAISDFDKGLVPDLIICDVMMPNITGFDLHQLVRGMPDLLHIPFLYLTALDDEEHFRKGMSIGADDYIGKPFSAQELRQSVAVRLERSQFLQENDVIPSSQRILKIHSMGGFEASMAGRRVQWGIKKSAAAFLFLLHSNKDIPIEIVKKELWWEPVVDNTVHVLNLRLRKIIKDFAELKVRKGNMSLTVDCPIEWDIVEFETLAKKAIESQSYKDSELAIKGYGGEFLPNFDVPWTERHRLHFDELYMQLLELSVETAPNDTSRSMVEGRLDRYLNG